MAKLLSFRMTTSQFSSIQNCLLTQIQIQPVYHNNNYIDGLTFRHEIVYIYLILSFLVYLLPETLLFQQQPAYRRFSMTV